MFTALPDSGGSIGTIFYHHTPKRINGELIEEGLFQNFLIELNKTGISPIVCAIATHSNEDERVILKKESYTWKESTTEFHYYEAPIERSFLNDPPYSQDIGLILNEPKSSILLTKSNRVIKFNTFMSKIEELFTREGYKIEKSAEKYNLEGGYFQATTEHIFYSTPEDREIINRFKQIPLFIEDIFIDTLKKIMKTLSLRGMTLNELPTHLDLIISILEREEFYDVFYVDIRENVMMNPFLEYEQYKKLEIIFNEWDVQMEKILSKLCECFKKVQFHKIPGILDFEEVPVSSFGIEGTAILPFLHSGVNLLFHSKDDRDYAFYLKYPSESEQWKDFEFNKQIEETLESSGVIAVPVSGDNENTNLYHVRNSAGIRCLIKVLSRSF